MLFAHTAYGDINAELIEAAAAGNTAKVEQLLQQGADVNAEGQYDRTALMRAARYGQTEMVKVLIAAGADVNARNEFGGAALMDAALDISGTEQIELLGKVADAAKRYGNLLRDRQVDRLVEMAADPDLTLATATESVMGALNLPNTELMPLLLQEKIPTAPSSRAGR